MVKHFIRIQRKINTKAYECTFVYSSGDGRGYRK